MDFDVATVDATYPLPRILEVKRTLDGREKRFECGVLLRRATHVVVLFVSPTPMRVHGVELPAGTVTLGHFWSDRPYNVYHWLDGSTGATIGHYVNVSDETHLSGDRLEWRDLVLDLLVLPGAEPLVLDEDELSVTADPALRARIEAGLHTALKALSQTVADLERHRRTLWPVVQRRTLLSGSPSSPASS